MIKTSRIQQKLISQLMFEQLLLKILTKKEEEERESLVDETKLTNQKGNGALHSKFVDEFWKIQEPLHRILQLHRSAPIQVMKIRDDDDR